MPRAWAAANSGACRGSTLRQKTIVSAQAMSFRRACDSRTIRAETCPERCRFSNGLTTVIIVEGMNPGSTAKMCGRAGL